MFIVKERITRKKFANIQRILYLGFKVVRIAEHVFSREELGKLVHSRSSLVVVRFWIINKDLLLLMFEF